MRFSSRLFVPTAIALALWATPGLAEQYQLDGCSVPPFPMDTDRRDIDKECGNLGKTKKGPKSIQNGLKNNLCRTGSLKTLTLADLRDLQKTVKDNGIDFGVTFGPNHKRVEHFPEDRNDLSAANLGKPYGEGDKVQIVALMEDPHYSDVGKGEDVNCNRGSEEENDIHITLLDSPAPPKPGKKASQTKKAAYKAALCKGIVAEVIPHYRPAAYEVDVLEPIAEKHIPVRISGQLFFDASHYPCRNGKGSPARASLWEIHPIYSIQVCKNKTLDNCPADDESVWTELHN